MVIDKFKPDESEKTPATFPSDEVWGGAEEGEDVIVGVAAWGLEEGSQRIGQFQGGLGLYYISVIELSAYVRG